MERLNDKYDVDYYSSSESESDWMKRNQNMKH